MNKICPRQHDIYIGFHDVTSKVLMKAFLKNCTQLMFTFNGRG